MKRILVGMAVAGALSGCASLPFFSTQSDTFDVQVEAKLVKGSGDVVSVVNTTFKYDVYDASYVEFASDSIAVKASGEFKTDFDGKATINIPEGMIVTSGSYSILSGKSSIKWTRAQILVKRSSPIVRLSNDNGKVTNID